MSSKTKINDKNHVRPYDQLSSPKKNLTIVKWKPLPQQIAHKQISQQSVSQATECVFPYERNQQIFEEGISVQYSSERGML